MASAVQKLLRRSGLVRRGLQSPIAASTFPLHRPHIIPPSAPLQQNPSSLNPSSGSSSAEILSKPPSVPIFPCFTLGLLSDPVVDSSFPVDCEESLGESRESNVVWADSVKKKRKKKMNKHKYRKLRKRLRRQT